MDVMYQPENWHEAFTVPGTGGLAIASLLIVEASDRAAEIMAVPYWRLRARNSTLGVLVITFGGLILVRQDPRLLGIELILLNMIGGALLPGPNIIHTLRHHTGLPLRIPLTGPVCMRLLPPAAPA